MGKDGTRDYTEIDSIPPLPLYALLAADQMQRTEFQKKVPKYHRAVKIMQKVNQRTSTQGCSKSRI